MTTSTAILFGYGNKCVYVAGASGETDNIYLLIIGYCIAAHGNWSFWCEWRKKIMERKFLHFQSFIHSFNLFYHPDI